MNSVYAAFLILNVIALGYLANADTKCYVCNSITDSGCGDPFKDNEKYVQACTNSETFCRKMVQTGKI